MDPKVLESLLIVDSSAYIEVSQYRDIISYQITIVT